MNDVPPTNPRPSWVRLAGVLASATVAVVVVLVFDLAPWLRGQGSGVWVWVQHPRPIPVALPALALSAPLVWLAASPLPRWAADRRSRRALLLAAIALLGWGLALASLSAVPGGVARTLVGRTIDPKFTSFHSVALSGMPDGPACFLGTHHERLAELPLHAATHPPGPSLYYRALIDFFVARPSIAEAIARALQVDDPTLLARLRPAQTPASIAAAMLGSLALLLAGQAAAWPVSRLVVRLTDDEEAGLRSAALWPLVPSIALMSPEFDQALALPVAAAALALVACVQARRTSTALASGVAAGAAAALALFVSYAAFAFLAGATLAAAALLVPGERRLPALAFVVAAIATMLLFFGTRLVGHHPLAAALEALALHGKRHTWQRSWAISTGLNIADTLLFLGPPLFVLLARRVAGWRASMRESVFAASPAERWSAALVLTFAFFVISGTVRGEAGRIFLPWMPLLLTAAVAGGARERRPLLPRGFAGALALMMAVWTCALSSLLRVP